MCCKPLVLVEHLGFTHVHSFPQLFCKVILGVLVQGFLCSRSSNKNQLGTILEHIVKTLKNEPVKTEINKIPTNHKRSLWLSINSKHDHRLHLLNNNTTSATVKFTKIVKLFSHFVLSLKLTSVLRLKVM